MSGHNKVFWILTPNIIEAMHADNQSDFLADDIMYAIQSATTKIATDSICLNNLQKQYPSYHRYEISVGKL
jgi:hypothetical protein